MTPRDADGVRSRMTGPQRREQLLEVGRKLFADKGFEGTSVEEIAAKAGVSKPVVYEHFGGKEGLYAVVVDREIRALLDGINAALRGSRPPARPARAGGPRAARLHRGVDRRLPDPRARLPRRPVDRVVRESDQRRRDAGGAPARRRVQAARLDPKSAPLYAQMLVGMVALTGQWWLDSPQVQEGRRRGAPGQPGLERPERTRGEATAQQPALTAQPGWWPTAKIRRKPRTTPCGSRG